MGELLDNFLKVYQLANFIKHSQLQTQLEQERMAAEQENHAYQRQMQDFQIRNAMMQNGAQEVAPIGDIQPGFGADWLQQGKKQQITAPGGTTYQMPTYEQQQNRLLDQLRAKKQIDVDAATTQAFNTEFQKQRAKFLFAKDERLDIPPEVADTLKIPRTAFNAVPKLTPKELKVYEDQYNRENKADPNKKFVTGVNDKGVVTGAVVDINTGQWKSLGAAPGVEGKTKGSVSAQVGMSTGARVLMEAAQKAIAKARESGDEADKQTARDLVDQATKAFPNELEGNLGEPTINVGGSAETRARQADSFLPSIQPKAKAVPAAPTPKGDKTFPASRLSEFARTKGMDANAARKYIMSQGYTIAEDQ